MSDVMECRDVVKTFTDGTRVLEILQGVNLCVPEGEILAISGPSGVGKSTLLHIMGTLDRPTKGDVFFRGKSLRKMSRSAINRLRNQDIGFVFQFYHLLPEFSALENVMLPALSNGTRPSVCRPRAVELLETVGLADRMEHKPGKLSGGEQQRVAIARALFNEPSVVLADEPTGNLDEHTGADITELLWALNRERGVTLVIVTHDEALASQAHRWIHLHEGRTAQREPLTRSADASPTVSP
jgi:lipoprotein-releasing system ATP-binding protein